MIFLFLRYCLSAIFLNATIGKLRAREEWRRSVSEFNFGSGSALVFVLVPGIEMITAVGLGVPRFAVYGAALATALSIAFVGVVAVNLARGRHPYCACFGRPGSGRITWLTLSRNVCIALLSTGVLLSVSPGAQRILGQLFRVKVGAVVECLLLTEATAILIVLWRMGRNRGAGKRSLPKFRLRNVEGAVITSDTLCASTPALLVFVNTGCTPCSALLEDLRAWVGNAGKQAHVIVIAHGSPATVRTAAREYGVADVLVDEREYVALMFNVRQIPSAVLIGADCTLDEEIGVGPHGVKLLAERIWGEAKSRRTDVKRN